MAANQFFQLPAAAAAAAVAAAPLAAAAPVPDVDLDALAAANGRRIPTWWGVVPGCYEAAILVEAVLRGHLTPATRGNTGNQEAAPTKGMVFVYEVGNDIKRFTSGDIKFSNSRSVHGGNAFVNIQVAKEQGIEPRRPSRGPYVNAEDLRQAVVDGPEPLDLAAVAWDGDSYGWDWVREMVGANHQAFPHSVRGGLVKKVFTIRPIGMNRAYAVLSVYDLQLAWPNPLSRPVPSAMFPSVVPRQAVLDGFQHPAHVMEEMVFYDIAAPENCAGHCVAATNAYNYSLGIDAIPAAPAVPAAPAAGPVSVPLPPHQPAGPVRTAHRPRPAPYLRPGPPAARPAPPLPHPAPPLLPLDQVAAPYFNVDPGQMAPDNLIFHGMGWEDLGNMLQPVGFDPGPNGDNIAPKANIDPALWTLNGVGAGANVPGIETDWGGGNQGFEGVGAGIGPGVNLPAMETDWGGGKQEDGGIGPGIGSASGQNAAASGMGGGGLSGHAAFLLGNNYGP